MNESNSTKARTVKGKSFREWLNEVDQAVYAKVGVSWRDLEDWRYYDAWSDGLSAKTAANRALRNSGWR